MNMKAVAAVVLVVAAFAIGAYILMGQPAGEEQEDPWAGREPMYIEDFAESVSSASEIYMVMDLRGAPEGKARTNIMQCAVDFSSSTAIGGTPKRIYSIESECIKSLDDGTTVTVPLEECLADIDAARDAPGKAIFYIRKANDTMIFANELVVGVGDDYPQAGCGISAVIVPVSNMSTMLPPLNASNRTGMQNYSTEEHGEIPDNSTQ